MPPHGYIVEKEIPLAGRHRVVGNPLQLSKTPATPQALFSDLGEHTEVIMQELGFSPDEIAVVEEQKSPPPAAVDSDRVSAADLR